MWMYIKIYDKENKIDHEPIIFNAQDYKVVIQNENEVDEYFNSEEVEDT